MIFLGGKKKMSVLKGACLFGQSGGPTSVINASAAGVFLEALKHDAITDIYGAEHGIVGILNERFFDMRQEDIRELELLKNTPSSALGSVRYKLKSADVDETDYIRLLEVFKKYNIRYFFYNGGNDSMDTCNKISKYLQSKNYECNIIGVPKTIDNDLFGTDHCPGYGSAAKYVATTMMEVFLEMANLKGYGPDLIYLPEKVFDIDTFLSDVKKVCAEKKNKAIIAISEGIKDKEGKYISEYAASLKKDSFGHAQLGGAASVLAGIVSDELNVKVRPIEFSLLQRCAAHSASGTDIEEAFNAGRFAVQQAVKGETDKMVVFVRDTNSKEYKIDYKLMDVQYAANTEKKVPLEWIKEDNTGLTKEFCDYALPLIQGPSNSPLEDGLPRFAKLKKILVKK
jgi:6-phosphofructokinase 1